MSAKQVKQLRAVREIYIDQLYSAYALAQSASVDKNLFPRLEVIYSKVDHVYAEFEKNHISIVNTLATLEAADFDEEKNVRSEFLDKYYSVKQTYNDLLALKNKVVTQTTLVPTTSSNSSSVAQLPKITLPTFDGNYTQWTTFIDLFNSLIHNNTSLDNIQRFNYLIASLKDEALALVKALPLTADNYQISYDSLTKRYQNSRLLSSTYWSKIMNVQKLAGDSAPGLRKLINTFSENLAALKMLGLPTESWDFVLFNLMIQKLDSATVRRFELQDASTDIPSYETLKQFLEKQCTAFESVALTSAKVLPQSHQISQGNRGSNLKYFHPKPHNSLVLNTISDSNKPQTHPCIFCNSTNHHIYKCPNFLSKTPNERSQIVRQNNWCVNCLHSAHSLSSCSSKRTCQFCKYRHHTLLHYDRQQHNSHASEQPIHSCHQSANLRIQQPISEGFTSQSNNSGFCQNAATQGQSALQVSVAEPSNFTSSSVDSFSAQAQSSRSGSVVLLATAQAEILDSYGNFQPLRILIDNCSQVNIMSQKCANRLGLPRSKASLSVFGVGQANSQALGLVNCTVRPKGKLNSVFRFEAVVLPKICLKMPTSFIPTETWKTISNVQLADATFNQPSTVDLLLGTEMFPHILEDGFLVGDNKEPSLMNTVFGWIALGKVSLNFREPQFSFFTSVEPSLDDTLKKFWELEEVPKVQSKSPEDTLCEEHYVNNTRRDSSGRYIVSLPFKETHPTFPGSKSIAHRRFLSLEKRLFHDSSLREEYSNFMNEYINSRYMELVPDSVPDSDSNYYIPHHCVLRPDSSTTKLRVVMDASAKCGSGISLNDALLTGAKLQKDLTSILLRFRLHFCVFSADIKQMYSQICLSQSDVDYQRLFWRFTTNEPIQTYRLLRVAFGVKCSPFLALRTISQLVQDEGHKFPLASKILLNDIFVDDTVSGFSSLSEAISARDQLISLLKCGGFELRKWTSNISQFLEGIPVSHLQQQVYREFDCDEDLGIKVLGLKWNPNLDSFSYSVKPLDRECTKRTILSELARIYDVLGFLSPLTFFAKHLIQHLWTLGIDWDEIPPQNVLEKWIAYKRQLPSLAQIKIPRFLFSSQMLSGELHGFCDSSEKGYAAVVYLRSSVENNIRVSLVCAKSKVAPLKRISIPRLELCAALLLSELLAMILRLYSEKVNIEKIFAWSDSTVTLAWIKDSPHRWKSFVSNRVTRIQENISPSHWHHVRSQDNPADVASRGLLPSELVSCSHWWCGPDWLTLEQSSWPINDHDNIIEDMCEEERKITLVAFVSLSSIDFLLETFSSLLKIQRIICVVLRFIHNCRNPTQRKCGPFVASELHEALLVLVKRVQHTSFSVEIENIENSKPLSKPFRSLNPFIGSDGILRVGGRLVYSGLSYDRKFPALLPQKNRLTELIIEQIHQDNFHPGLQTLQFLISQRFWIFSARRAIRRSLSQCLKCYRLNPTPVQPFMGNLPSFRVSQAKPFSVVGVDYGGPFMVTLGKSRGVKAQKAYLCLFVCACTKAVHLELASDLSSEAFLACLRRFIARRGRCVKIFSDQGTNFVGASNELEQMSKFMQDSSAEERIEWSFNPPSSPHFGGLFEAGIKAAKSHLFKVIGGQVLTYEELYTVLCQIESLLNSRPLCPLSSDPSDLSVLTPGHFLTMEPLTSLPDPNLQNVPLNRLSRWQLLQRLHQDFWKRWHNSYLNTLQQRYKWNLNAPNIEENTVVLIKNDSPPLTWKLGRVTKLHSGKDGIARVATVRTATGQLQRPLVKLCPLPHH